MIVIDKTIAHTAFLMIVNPTCVSTCTCEYECRVLFLDTCTYHGINAVPTCGQIGTIVATFVQILRSNGRMRPGICLRSTMNRKKKPLCS